MDKLKELMGKSPDKFRQGEQGRRSQEQNPGGGPPPQ